MAAVHVPQAARVFVVFQVQQRCITALRRTLTEELVHQAQCPLDIIFQREYSSNRRLQVGPEECSGNSLPGDVADHHSDLPLTPAEKVVKVSADVTSAH